MKTQRLITVILISSALTTAALGRGPVTGIWNGKQTFDFAKLPPTLTAQQKAMVSKKFQKFSQTKLKLTLLANKTFTIVVSGVTPQPPNVSGTWSKDEKSIILVGSKGGKAQPPVAFAFDKTGKSFAFSNGPVTISFTR